MKRVIIRGGLFFTLVLIPILAVDYYVDSYASFRLTYDRIGQIGINSNFSVGSDISLSERKLKWAMINHMEPVNCMILGSSRSMLFSSDNLGVDSFFNLGVTVGGSIEDYMAETYILYLNDKLPNYMLIEIHPAMFNGNYIHSNWSEWGDNTYYMKKNLNGDECKKDDSDLLGIQVRDIISPAYFKYNIEQLEEGKRTYIKIHNSVEDDTLATHHIDGSYSYSREYQKMNSEKEIALSINQICDGKKTITGCYNYYKLDPEIVNEFESLISFLLNHDVNVSFYLPPYSEELYDYISEEICYAPIIQVENYILRFARDHNLQVYGSYNPQHCRITPKDLYDSYHIKEDRLVDTLWPRCSDINSFWTDRLPNK